MRLRTLFDSHWKKCFSSNVSVLSALEVPYENALYKSAFYLLTYLLTKLHQFLISVFLFFCVLTLTGKRIDEADRKKNNTLAFGRKQSNGMKTEDNWHFWRSTESREEAELAGDGRRLSRKGRRSREAVAVRITASMISPSTPSVSELCPPLLNRASERRVLDDGPSRRPASDIQSINQSIFDLLVACQNASQQFTTVIHVALVQEWCA